MELDVLYVMVSLLVKHVPLAMRILEALVPHVLLEHTILPLVVLVVLVMLENILDQQQQVVHVKIYSFFITL